MAAITTSSPDGPPTGSPEPAWKRWLCVIWPIGFSLLFYSFDLPNHRPSATESIHRWEVWLSLLLEGGFLPAAEDRVPSGWRYLPQRFDLIVTAACVLAGAWGLGRLLLRAMLGAARICPFLRFVFAMGVGLSAASLMTLGFGLLGWLSRPLFLAAIAAFVVLESGLSLRDRRRAREAEGIESGGDSPATAGLDSGSARSLSRRMQALCALVCLPFLAAMLLGSLLPSTDFDVKEYHLQGPKEFYQNGRITFLPHNVYTSFPFLTEMLSLQAMVIRGDWFRGAMAGKGVLMCFGPLTALGLFAAGRRWFSPAAGWLAALVHLTTPWTFRISIIAYAEGGLSFYLLTALLATWLAMEARPSADAASQTQSTRRLMLLAGFLAGSAMACKYTGLVSVVLPLGLAAAWGVRKAESPRVALQTVLLFAAGAAVAVGPWLLKNLVETGNPVYPLAYSIFGGVDWNEELNAKWKAAHSPPDEFDFGRRVVEVTLRNDWLSPLLYGFAPLALLASPRRRRRETAWLWGYVGWLFLSWWLFTHRLDRFWVPMLPVVALLAGGAADVLRGRVVRSAAYFVCVAAIVFNLFMVTSGASGMNRFLAEQGALQDWIEQRFSSNLRYLNRTMREGDRALLVGEAEVFDARRPIVYNTVFDESLFELWTGRFDTGDDSATRPLASPETIRERFRQEGITFVMVNWQEILRYRVSYGYTAYVTPQKFAELQEIGVLGPPLEGELGRIAQLNPQEQAELTRWGADLVVAHPTAPAYWKWQVFPVRVN